MISTCSVPQGGYCQECLQRLRPGCKRGSARSARPRTSPRGIYALRIVWLWLPAIFAQYPTRVTARSNLSVPSSVCCVCFPPEALREAALSWRLRSPLRLGGSHRTEKDGAGHRGGMSSNRCKAVRRQLKCDKRCLKSFSRSRAARTAEPTKSTFDASPATNAARYRFLARLGARLGSTVRLSFIRRALDN